MIFGHKNRHNVLGLGHKIRHIRHNTNLGSKLGHNLAVGGKVVSNVSKTGSMVTGLAGLALGPTPAGLALQSASKGLLATSIASREVGKGGLKMERKSKRIKERNRRNNLEDSGYL